MYRVSQRGRHTCLGLQGAATELALIQWILISTPSCWKTHCAASFCGLLFPPSKLHEVLRLLYAPLTFTRSLSLGVFSWDHSKWERLIYFYACQNSSWRRCVCGAGGGTQRSVGTCLLPWRQWAGWHCVVSSLGVGSAWRNLTTDSCEGSWPKHLLSYILGWEQSVC